MAAQREYVQVMRERYARAVGRAAKGAVLDEIERVLGWHRKHAIRALARVPLREPRVRRGRPRQYLACLSAIDHAQAAATIEQAEALAAAPRTTASAAGAGDPFATGTVAGSSTAGALGKTAASAVTTFATTYAIGKVADDDYRGGRTLEAERGEVFARELECGRTLFARDQGDVQQQAAETSLGDWTPPLRG